MLRQVKAGDLIEVGRQPPSDRYEIWVQRSWRLSWRDARLGLGAEMYAHTCRVTFSDWVSRNGY